MRHQRKLTLISVVSCSLLLAACGGGGDSGTDVPPPAPSPSPAPTTPTDAQRASAATTTAQTNPNCAENVLGPFYWEVGDGNGVKASGQVGSGVDGNTKMSIASASKWVYSTYVVQKRGGVNSADVPYLNFTSGYTQFNNIVCSTLDTVASCLGGETGQEADTINKFAYGSGHMQNHAVSRMNLGSMTINGLGAEIASALGSYGFQYGNPNLAGGLIASGTGYGGFLRAMLRGSLTMKGSLGVGKVCADPDACGGVAVHSPITSGATGETWYYSLGHWVEDDPRVGDHAFSSAGALGFYPWIDRTKTNYGVLARRAENERNAGYNSAKCGRMIRQAWMTGVATAATLPTP